jgi:phage shock protein PspC (stress-responsive transcriptional regulator)
LVEKVIAQLGMPDGEPYIETPNDPISDIFSGNRPTKKFFRNPDNKTFGGVCSGIAAYLNIDILLVRIVFIVAFFMGSAGFWIYLIILIAAPEARTAVEKCELRGIPATAENIKRFTRGF